MRGAFWVGAQPIDMRLYREADGEFPEEYQLSRVDPEGVPELMQDVTYRPKHKDYACLLFTGRWVMVSERYIRLPRDASIGNWGPQIRKDLAAHILRHWDAYSIGKKPE